jgi:hypothetical protein
MAPVDHPRNSPSTDSKLSLPSSTGAASEPEVSPLERGTRVAVQASLRYHGRKR